MSQNQTISRNGVLVRLTDERWQHIIEEHSELTGLRDEVLRTISSAEHVLSGATGELLALRMTETDKATVVVYRETELDDGFVITAFVTRRLKSLERRIQLWPPQT